MNPRMSYEHVLKELSVNRKDPCEVIRELISNSYDAKATQIKIFPLLQYEGFIFFDNGEGLGKENVTGKSISPYEAFFSIGLSTKTRGQGIGYKCQGSKLCFASTRIAVITRSETEQKWRYKIIDNPQVNLTLEFDLKPEESSTPWEILSGFFANPDQRTEPILAHLNQNFFEQSFTTGTMIIIDGLKVDSFATYFGTRGDNNTYSYLHTYIRYSTRRGNVTILESNNDTNHCELHLWTANNNQLELIPAGYPYISNQKNLHADAPSQINSLKDGRFWARYKKDFRFSEKNYQVILAIDGDRRRREELPELGRQGRGNSRSGISLSEQSGTFIAAQGVKSAKYNELFEEIEGYKVLATPNAQKHYTFFINGDFDLVTNRNDLAEDSLKVLRQSDFMREVKIFLDEVSDGSHCLASSPRPNIGNEQLTSILRDFIDSIKKEDTEKELEQFRREFDLLTSKISERTRFRVNSPEFLKEKWFVHPQQGEEHGVGGLYFLFSHLVPPDSPYKDLWLRPLTFSGQGIDSLALSLSEGALPSEKIQGLEYKFRFANKETYNHPLKYTRQIVCWDDLTFRQKATDDNNTAELRVYDEYGYFGTIKAPADENFKKIGWEIADIQDQAGNMCSHNIKVICLKLLIEETFGMNTTTVPTKDNSSSKKTKRR